MKRFEIELAVKDERELLPEYKQHCDLMAEQMMIYRSSLIEQGFTDEQAMEIIVCHGVDAGRSSHINN